MNLNENNIKQITPSLQFRILQLEKELFTLRQQLAAGYNTIMIYHKGLRRIIPVHLIVMIRAQSNYTDIFLLNGEKLLTPKTLKHWQTNITSPDFIRSHASFLINKWHIQHIDLKNHELLMAGGYNARISRAVDKGLFDFFR